MASKWAYLKDTYPTLPADPSYGDALKAQLASYRGLPLAEVAQAYNDLEEELAEREQEVKELNLKLEASRMILEEQMDAAGLESVTVAGYRWTPKFEPYPQVKNKAELRAWAGEHMPDNLQLHHGTLKSTVKEALETGTELPPGVDVFLKRSFSRTRSG